MNSWHRIILGIIKTRKHYGAMAWILTSFCDYAWVSAVNFIVYLILLTFKQAILFLCIYIYMWSKFGTPTIFMRFTMGGFRVEKSILLGFVCAKSTKEKIPLIQVLHKSEAQNRSEWEMGEAWVQQWTVKVLFMWRKWN